MSMMRKIGYIAVGLLIVISLTWLFRSEQSRWYRFIVAGDQLFALEYTDAYGTEQRLFVTHDLGESWNAVDAPRKTCAIAGDGRDLVVATSRGEIWRKNAEDATWSRLHGPLVNNPYFYCILLSGSGDIIAVGKDAVYLFDANARLRHEFSAPSPRSDQDELFVNASFASDDEQFLIVEANPFSIYVIDLEHQTLQPWLEGVPSAPSGLSGPARVRHYGDDFLLSHPTGMYVSSELLAPWQSLNTRIRHDDYLGGNFCRDLIEYGRAPDQWIVATNSGIHVMDNGDELKTIYADEPGDHYLIREFTQHNGHYFVSFARLTNGCMGIRVTPDLSKWEPLWLQDHNR